MSNANPGLSSRLKQIRIKIVSFIGKKFRENLAVKLLTAIIVVLAIGFSVYGFVLISDQEAALSKSLKGEAQTLSEMVAYSSLEPIIQMDYPSIDTILVRLGKSNPDIVRIQVHNTQGFAVASYDGEDAKQFDKLLANSSLIHVQAPMEIKSNPVGSVKVWLSKADMLRTIAAVKAKLILSILLFSVFLSVALFYGLNRLVLSPLGALKAHTETIGRGNLGSKLKLDREDELGKLADSFNAMTENLSSTTVSRDVLDKEAKTVSNLLNNMQQAVFSIDNQGKIIPPVSKFSNSVFQDAIEGKTLFETVYAGIAPSSEAGAAIKTAIVSVFGEDEMQWDLSEDSFPKKVLFTKGSAEPQILKVGYSPLRDANGLLEKLMLVIEDVTEVERLERKVKEEEASRARNTQILQDLSNNEQDQIKSFFLGAAKMLAECNDLVATLGQNEEGSVIFSRNLHTVKGNARLLGFHLVSAETHKLESTVIDKLTTARTKNTPIDAAAVEDITLGLQEIQGQLTEYARMAKKAFRIDSDFETLSLRKIHETVLSLEKAFDHPSFNLGNPGAMNV